MTLVGCAPQPTEKQNAPAPAVQESASSSTSCSHGVPIAYTGSTVQKVSEIARAVTVCITSQTPGSGVIIKRQGNVYTVLTAAHVVATEDKYKVVTPDSKQYSIDYKTVKRFPDKIDLAILQFTSDKDYRVVEIGDSAKAVADTPNYVAGFPLQSEESTMQNYRFSDGQISANAGYPLKEGYALAYYNDTFSGMSGGPVLDEQGKLIGIHGQSKVATDLVEQKGIDPEIGMKFGLNLAIPIYIPMRFIAQLEPGLGFQTVAAPTVPPEQKADDAFLQGLDKHIAGDRQGAIADYNRAIRLNPKFAAAYFGRGNIRFSLGEPKEAIADYTEVIRLNPNFAPAYYNRGKVRSDLGDKKGAIADYTQTIRLNPNLKIAYNNRGLSRSALGDKKGAIADYDRAIHLDPNFDRAYMNRGNSRSDLGSHREAIADFDQAIRLNPNYADAYVNRGITHTQLGDPKSAIADYDRAIRLNPNIDIAYNGRGINRSDLGDRKGAIADYTQAIRLNPNNDSFFTNRGIARAELQDKQGAIADFDRAIYLNPKSALAYKNRGINRLALGDKKGAIADLQKAAILYEDQGKQSRYREVIRLLSQISR